MFLSLMLSFLCECMCVCGGGGGPRDVSNLSAKAKHEIENQHHTLRKHSRGPMQSNYITQNEFNKLKNRKSKTGTSSRAH